MVEHPTDPVTAKYRLLYTVAIVLYLAALALIDMGVDDELTPQVQRNEALVHLLGAIIVTIIGLTVTGATPTMFVAMIAVVMVVQVIYSIYQSSKEDNTHHEG